MIGEEFICMIDPAVQLESRVRGSSLDKVGERVGLTLGSGEIVSAVAEDGTGIRPSLGLFGECFHKFHHQQCFHILK